MTIGSFGSALPLMLLLLVALVGAAQTVPLAVPLVGGSQTSHLAVYPVGAAQPVQSYACNVKKFDPTAPFNATLNKLLSNMEHHTPSNRVVYKTSVPGSEGSSTAYGESVCVASLSASNCTNCLTSIFNQLLGICSFAIGAQGASSVCALRYEQYQF